MVGVKVEIKNLDKLRASFSKAPGLTLKYLSMAVQASVFEIEKQSVDRNFQFKTPRGMRTGYLEQSFAFGKHFDAGGLMASIGPTALYAPYVYFGTNRGIKPNPFMDRIARASEAQINKYFEQAVDVLTGNLAGDDQQVVNFPGGAVVVGGNTAGTTSGLSRALYKVSPSISAKFDHLTYRPFKGAPMGWQIRLGQKFPKVFKKWKI